MLEPPYCRAPPTLFPKPPPAPPPPLQRVNFPALNKQCQPGSSCTACMCQLSNAMAVAKGDPADLSLCLNNFRWVLRCGLSTPPHTARCGC